MEAFYDLDAIRENIITQASKKGSKKMRRLGRNDDFLKDLDSIDMGFYSIKKKIIEKIIAKKFAYLKKFYLSLQCQLNNNEPQRNTTY